MTIQTRHPLREKTAPALLILGCLGAPGHAENRVPQAPAPTLGPLAELSGVDLGARPCVEAGPCPSAREVFVDYDALGVGELSGGEWLSYDFSAVTRALSYAELQDEPELSLAVRLIVSEIGADRLLANRYGLLEAVGILYTVDNRLSPAAYDPENRRRVPIFPGCGTEGTFASCANASQYLGMGTWRALDPGSRYDPGLLEAAVDVAVVAWWLEERGLVPDFTEGATNYTHRCGDAGYGLTTHHCDRHMGRPRGDVKGANPFTGPLVFRTPEVFLDRRGHYSLYVSRWVDYDPWWSPPDVGADERAEILAEDGLDAEIAVDGLADGIGFAEDEGVWRRLLRVHGQGA